MTGPDPAWAGGASRAPMWGSRVRGESRGSECFSRGRGAGRGHPNGPPEGSKEGPGRTRRWVGEGGGHWGPWRRGRLRGHGGRRERRRGHPTPTAPWDRQSRDPAVGCRLAQDRAKRPQGRPRFHPGPGSCLRWTELKGTGRDKNGALRGGTRRTRSWKAARTGPRDPGARGRPEGFVPEGVAWVILD